MTEQSIDATRTRLLDAALEVFSEKGFSKASVRDICQRAQANIAAINYHFGDKAQLYREVFERVASRLESFAQALELDDPRQALTTYYRQLLAPLAEGDRAMQVARLRSREEFEPTGLLPDMRCTLLKPVHERLVQFVCREVGAKQADAHIDRLAFSLVGMGTFYLHAQPVVEALKPEILTGPAWLDDLANQLAEQGLTLLQAHKAHRAEGDQ